MNKKGQKSKCGHRYELITHNLTMAYLNQPSEIKRFFRPQFYPSPAHPKEVKRQLAQVPDRHLKRVLSRNVDYVTRFGVTMFLSGKPPYFRVRAIVPWGSKLHVRIVKDHLGPRFRIFLEQGQRASCHMFGVPTSQLAWLSFFGGAVKIRNVDGAH
jgi:hypothetical protein